MVKGTYVDKNGVRKGAWTQDEDDRLRAYVEQHGHSNWRLLPKFAGLDRCGKSCRLRWMNYLKPGVRRGDFTQEERDLIAKLHHQHGNKWSRMAAELPGRTDHGIKNYWHAHHKTTTRTSKSSAGKDKGVSCTCAAPSTFKDVFVLESSQSHFPTPLLPISSDSSTASMPTQDLSGFHDTFWTHPFLLDTHSYHDYGDFRVYDDDDDDDDDELGRPFLYSFS